MYVLSGNECATLRQLISPEGSRPLRGVGRGVGVSDFFSPVRTPTRHRRQQWVGEMALPHCVNPETAEEMGSAALVFLSFFLSFPIRKWTSAKLAVACNAHLLSLFFGVRKRA